ncbi:carotenoid biosynthesis protein [Novosphingobium colocasiae]|uniref:carotenoid biosynthesis protein n=1 Tax=Novosphingobium colocasiae TaxID=1256513 RepID=UPI0035AFDDAA
MSGGKAVQATAIAALALWIAFTAISILAPAAPMARTASFMAIAMLFLFAIAHSIRRLGARRSLVLLVSGMVIANIYENLSISTGFPFGSYHHTAAFGPWLLQVPIIVGPIFYSLCYLAWTLGTMILGTGPRTRSALRVFGLPVIGAFIATGWDLCSDPIGATIARSWVYAHSGAYYGVPLSNYLGWFLCTWTIIQCWTLYLDKAEGDDAGTTAPLSYWYQASALWTAMGLQYPLLLLASPASRTVTDTGGWAWRSRDIIEAAVIMSIYTMLAAAVTATLAVTVRREATARA